MASWVTTERIAGKLGTAKSVILDTAGCSYDRCYMCSYKLSCPEKTPDSIVSSLTAALSGDFQKIKIFTSGSFFDPSELTSAQRLEMASALSATGVREVTVESRPEYITEEAIRSFSEGLGDATLEVAIGLESANDAVLRYCINKGFTFKAFEAKARLLRDMDCRVKAYLLLKPPFLTEYEAMLDVLDSAKAVAHLADTISVNPVSIHKETVVEQLWVRGAYRPPYLWTLVECLNELSDLGPYVLSHPVAPGKARGIHNCGECDAGIMGKIEEYNLHGTKIEAECSCREAWERELTRIF